MKFYALLTFVTFTRTFAEASGNSVISEDDKLATQQTGILPSGDVDISTVSLVTPVIQSSESESNVLLSKLVAQEDKSIAVPQSSSFNPPLASPDPEDSAQIGATAFSEGVKKSNIAIPSSGGDIFHSITVSLNTNSITEAVTPSDIFFSVTPSDNEASVQRTSPPEINSTVSSHSPIPLSLDGPGVSDLTNVSIFHVSVSLTPVSHVEPTAAATHTMSHFSVPENTESMVDFANSMSIFKTEHPEPRVSSATASFNVESLESNAIVQPGNDSPVLPKKNAPSSNSGLTTSAKIGIGVIVPLCLLLIVIMGFLVYRRSRFTARSLKAMLTQRIKYKNAAHSCDEGMLIMPDRQT